MDLIIDFVLLCVLVSLAYTLGRWLMNLEDRFDKMEKLVKRHDDTLYPLAMPYKVRKEDRHEDSGH